jgi:uncharacterized integral membrane protein
MQAIFRLLRWALKAALFFTLFAFALNNQHEATVHFFFGTFWRAPLVLVVLAAFSAGVAVGVLGMVPRWWRQRGAARNGAPASSQAPVAEPAPREELARSPAAPPSVPLEPNGLPLPPDQPAAETERAAGAATHGT